MVSPRPSICSSHHLRTSCQPIPACSFNATVFSTIAANSYDVYSVNPGVFVEDGDKKLLVNESLVPRFPYHSEILKPDGHGYAEAHLERYPKAKCIEMFARSFVSDLRFVILELDRNQTLNHTSTLAIERHVDVDKALHSHDSNPCSWLCLGNGPADGVISSKSSRCNPAKLEKSDWNVLGHNVSGCYSHEYQENCKLEIASQLAIAVVIITSAKVLILLLCAFVPREMPLLTMGDAICSFVANPDPHTAQMPFAQTRKRTTPWAWAFSPFLIFGLPQWRQFRIHASGVGRCAIILLL